MMSIANRISDLYTRILDKLMDIELWESLFYGALKIVSLVILAKIMMRLGSATILHVLSNQAVKLDERRIKTLTILGTSINLESGMKFKLRLTVELLRRLVYELLRYVFGQEKFIWFRMVKLMQLSITQK